MHQYHSAQCINSLVDERQDLSTDVLSPGLLVVHDTGRGGEDDLSERSSGEEQVDPVLDLRQLNVESRRDDSSLVDSTVELNDNLARSVIVNLLELLNVTYSLVSFRRLANLPGLE